MDVYELVVGLRGRYTSMVEPLIERGNYQGAYWELMDIAAVLKMREREIIVNVHGGWNYMLSVDFLCKEMEEGKAPSKRRLQEYHAYAAQIELPL